MHASFQRYKKRARQAFTLVELLFALVITSFSLLIILGLVPVGLSAFLRAQNYGISSQIAQQVFSDIQCTPYYSLAGQVPPNANVRIPNSTNQGGGFVRYYDDNAKEIASTGSGTPSGSVFQVNIRLQNTPHFVGCGISNSTLALVTIQIAYNPGNLVMDMDSTGTIWLGTSGGTTIVPIFTFQSLVSRNS